MPDYVEWFVNREKQYDGFQRMLAGGTPKRIMCVRDQQDTGKSWLIQRLRHHCDEHQIPAVHVDFRDRQPHDYLSLVRLARDQIDPQRFAELTLAINQGTSVQITVASDSERSAGVVMQEIRDSTIHVEGDIIGGDHIHDNNFYVQGESEVARRATEIKINDAFFACLTQVQANGPVVFLFDSCEAITDEASRWIQSHLMVRLRAGQLGNLLVIVAGRELPALPDMSDLVATTSLPPLDEGHVQEYIARRQIAGVDIATVFKMSGGNPKLLSMMADAASVQAGHDDEWL